jgi:uncharacterized protein YodC (DUF2158 family)
MASKFKLGQVVRLRSGGPDMTVAKTDAMYHDGEVQCQWFGGRKLEHGWFPIENLVEATADDGKKK